MSIKDSARKTRIGRLLEVIAVGVAVLVLFGGGAFMLVLWFFAEADSSVEGRSIAFLMGVAFWAMAVLLVYGWRRSSREWPRAVAERVGVPDSVQHPGNARSTMTNIPNALRGQKPPNDAEVVAGRSIRYTRILLMVILAIGVGLLYLGWNIETIIPEWYVSSGYLFMGIGALLLIGGLWPSNWRKRLLGFIAIPEGIYVHGQGVYPDGHERATPETRWLFVPWANVVDVREGLAFGASGPGGAVWWPSTKLSLRVTPDEAREWFPYADDEPSDDGKSRIVSLDYSDSDPSPKETVPRLKRLWARSRV